MEEFNLAVSTATRLITTSEGCALLKSDGLVYPYTCPAGYPTQGYGILVKDLAVPPVSREEAATILANAVPVYMAMALKSSPILLKYPRKLGAITSFVFNLGAARYRASTLRRRVNAEDWDAAATELRKWVYGGGRKLPGLVIRREAEARVVSE